MVTMLLNYGPSVTAFLKIYVSKGSCDKSTLDLIIDHHRELRDCLKSRLSMESQQNCIETNTATEYEGTRAKSEEKDHSTDAGEFGIIADVQASAVGNHAVKTGSQVNAGKKKNKSRKKRRNNKKKG